MGLKGCVGFLVMLSIDWVEWRFMGEYNISIEVWLVGWFGWRLTGKVV